MPYAAALIDRAMTATNTTQSALAGVLGVSGPTVSQWRHGTHPMPEDRVMQLCALAGIEDVGPWLVAAQADAARSDAVRAALETVLDRLRPALAGVGLVVLVFAGFFVPYRAEAMPKSEAEPAALCTLCAMLRRRLAEWLATMGRRHGVGYASPVLA